MFNKYPYTDFHELNLDWFLTQFKDLVSNWEDFQSTITREWNDYKSGLDQEWADVQAAWTALYNYVHDYFDNLDVQDEINNKLDQMAADGTFIRLFAPYLPFITPEMYGAIGDGITDDSQAITTAINAAADNQLPLQFLNKSYYMATPYMIPANTVMRVKIIGTQPRNNPLLLHNTHYGWTEGTNILIGSSFISGANNATSQITGEISNIGFIPYNNQTAVSIFNNVRLNALTFEYNTCRWIETPFNNAYIMSVSYIQYNYILNVKICFSGSVVDSYIKNNYISGNTTADAVCFNCNFADSLVDGNFIDYFKSVYTPTDAYEIRSCNNTYEIFGNLVYKPSPCNYNFVSINDNFVGYSISYLTDHAMDLIPNNEGIFLIDVATKLDIIGPSFGSAGIGYLINDALSAALYPAYAYTHINISGIHMHATYDPLGLIHITKSYHLRVITERPFINIDILPVVDALPDDSQTLNTNIWNTMKVIYNGNLYVYLYGWKQITT